MSDKDVELEDEEDLCEECGNPESDCECCTECGSYYCDTCGSCGEKECMCICCEDCGCSPCECNYCSECECNPCECDGDVNGTMGHSTKPGWIERGHKVTNVISDQDWAAVWTDIDPKMDPVMMSAMFYVLEAIAADVPNGVQGNLVRPMFPNTREQDDELLAKMGVPKSKRAAAINKRDKEIAERRESDPAYDLSWIMGEAELMLAELVDEIDKTLVAYFHMACAGEARHHQAIGGKVLAGPRNRNAAWTGWKKIYDAVGPEAIKDLSALLLEIGGGSYGGVRWADAADVLYQRVTGGLGPTEAMNKRLFIDRAWTLQHNGGCFLNKIEWGIQNRRGWSLNMVQEKVLEAHCSNPPNWRVMASVCDDATLDLFNRYWETANKRRVALGLEEVENPWLNVQTRTICRYCNSNPAVGHTLVCGAPKMDDFDGGALDQGGKSWFIVVDEDDWSNWRWNQWSVTEQPVGPDGSIELTTITPAKVTFGISINSTGRGNKSYSRNKQVTLEEAMNMDFIPKSFGKSQGALGKIKGFEYNLTVHVKINGQWTQIASQAKYVCGFSPNEGYYEDDVYWPMAKVQKWKSTPISVGEVITTSLPHLNIVPPTPEQIAEIEAAAAKVAAEKEKMEKQMASLKKKLAKGPIGPQASNATGSFTYVLSTNKPKVTTS